MTRRTASQLSTIMTENDNSEVRFCIRCGNRLNEAFRFGRMRPVCPSCGWIFFTDPKVAAAGLIVQEGKVLLARRAYNPQRGLWTLPAGFVDAGEDPRLTVERECLEETGLPVRVTALLDVIHGQEHPRGAHILIVYRAELISDANGVQPPILPGDDVDEVGFFAIDSLPPLAFSTTEKILVKI
jgi:8-oxo-dGTP diphosphatase